MLLTSRERVEAAGVRTTGMNFEAVFAFAVAQRAVGQLAVGEPPIAIGEVTTDPTRPERFNTMVAVGVRHFVTADHQATGTE